MKTLKKLCLFLFIYALFTIGAIIAIECSWKCLPLSWIIGGAGFFGIDYYAEHYFDFNKLPWE